MIILNQKDMTRTEQLRTCKKCNNINFDIKKGFICSVSSDYARFENKCIDFNQASFVSKKKVLKPSQLIGIDAVNPKSKKISIRRILVIFSVVLLGCMMIDDPYLFSMDSNELTDSFARKLMNFIWGIPTGLLALFAGFYLAYQLLAKRIANY